MIPAKRSADKVGTALESGHWSPEGGGYTAMASRETVTGSRVRVALRGPDETSGGSGKARPARGARV